MTVEGVEMLNTSDRGELHDIDSWRYEVANGDTVLGLADWKRHRDEAEASEETP